MKKGGGDPFACHWVGERVLVFFSVTGSGRACSILVQYTIRILADLWTKDESNF